MEESSSDSERSAPRRLGLFRKPPRQRDEDYDSDDERLRRKRLRTELAARLGSAVNGCIRSTTLQDVATSFKIAAAAPLDHLDEEVSCALKASRVQLQPFQTDGVRWVVRRMVAGVGVILADEMGLGKTIQAVTVYDALRRIPLPAASASHRFPRKLLVVSPLSVCPTWVFELQQVAQGALRVVSYSGALEQRQSIMAGVEKHAVRYHSATPQDSPQDTAPSLSSLSGGQYNYDHNSFDVLVTTPEYMLSDAYFLTRIYFDMIVVDEAHRLKNSESRLYDAFLTSESLCRAPYRLLLTGTPLSNAPLELYNLIRVVNADAFAACFELNGDRDPMQHGRRRHGGSEQPLSVVQRNLLLVQDAPTAAALRSLTNLVLLRRVKQDVLRGLPPIHEVVLRLPMSPMQLRMYAAMLTKDPAVLAAAVSHNGVSTAGGSKPQVASATALLNVLMQLRKLCNHPYMFPGVEPEPFSMGEHLVTNSSKMVMLDVLLKQLLAANAGHRVLVFSQFQYTLDILQDYLEYRNYRYVRLDGSVRGEERQAAVSTFQGSSSEAELPFVFLLSTRAGGVGLTLTAADTVIFYDSDWNPQMDLQAQQRAHRIGQTKPVTVYRLLCQHTVEEAMQTAAAKKLRLAASYGLSRDVDVTDSVGTSKEERSRVLLQCIRLGVAAMRSVQHEHNDAERSWLQVVSSLNLEALLIKSSNGDADTWEAACSEGTTPSVVDMGASQEPHVQFEATLKARVEELLAAKRTEEMTAASANPSQRRRHRLQGVDVAEEHDACSTDEALIVSPAVLEARRWMKLEKAKWSKSGYISSCLPLHSTLYPSWQGTSTLLVCTVNDNSGVAHAEEEAAVVLQVRSYVQRAFMHGAAVVGGAVYRQQQQQQQPPKLRAGGDGRTVALKVDDDDDQGCTNEEENDGSSEDDDGVQRDMEPPSMVCVSHVTGDVLRPIAAVSRHRSSSTVEVRIAVIPVNNSGVWGGGRLFNAVKQRCPGIDKQYAAAKENDDLRLGNTLIFWATAADKHVHDDGVDSSHHVTAANAAEQHAASTNAFVLVALVVIQKAAATATSRTPGGDVDMKALSTAMSRLAAYARYMESTPPPSQGCCSSQRRVSFHFPQFTALSTEAAYTLDKILAAVTTDPDHPMPCVVYHAPRHTPRGPPPCEDRHEMNVHRAAANAVVAHCSPLASTAGDGQHARWRQHAGEYYFMVLSGVAPHPSTLFSAAARRVLQWGGVFVDDPSLIVGPAGELHKPLLVVIFDPTIGTTAAAWELWSHRYPQVPPSLVAFVVSFDEILDA